MAILFDGVDDFVGCGSGSNLDNLSSLSVSFWIKKTTSLNSRTILSKYSGGLGWDITVENNTTNIFFEQSYDGGGTYLGRTGSSVFVSGTYTHVVITWNGSSTATNVHIYKNGTEVSYSFTNNGGTTRDSEAAGNLQISDIYDAHFDGTLQELAIWNTVISAGDITTLYNSGTIKKNVPNTVSTSSLVGYWPMDDGQDGTSADAATVRDASGNGNTGTGDNGANNTGLTWKDTNIRPSVQSFLGSLQTSNRIVSKLPSPLTGSFALTVSTFSVSGNVTVSVPALSALASLQTSTRIILLNPSALSGSLSLQQSNRIAQYNPSALTGNLTLQTSSRFVIKLPNSQTAVFVFATPTLSGGVNTTFVASALTVSSSLQSVSIYVYKLVNAQNLSSSLETSTPKGIIQPNSLALAMQQVTPSVLLAFNTTYLASPILLTFTLYGITIEELLRRSVIYTHNLQPKSQVKNNIRFDNQKSVVTKNITKNAQVKVTTKAEF